MNEIDSFRRETETHVETVCQLSNQYGDKSAKNIVDSLLEELLRSYILREKDLLSQITIYQKVFEPNRRLFLLRQNQLMDHILKMYKIFNLRLIYNYCVKRFVVLSNILNWI
jgi:hypothetical protein